MLTAVSNIYGRHQAKQRLALLRQIDAPDVILEEEVKKLAEKEDNSKIGRLLSQADCGLHKIYVLIACILFASLFAYIASLLLTSYLVPVYGLLGALLPFAWLRSRVEKRAREFADDFPSVMLATASSMKAGMTPLRALERSILLLPEQSLARMQIRKLSDDLNSGTPKDLALRSFGKTIALPELELFRRAFTLVLDHGGKFSPTLERIAMLTKDRLSLLGSARVSTSTMRMTSNILLVVTPIALLLVSLRSEKYWQLIIHDPTANTIASIGVVIITLGVLALRVMSNFRP